MKGQWIIKEVYFEDGFPKIIRDLQPETPYVDPEVTPDDLKLMQQALDALQYASDETTPEGLHGCECLICKAIPALKDRIKEKNHE